MKEENYIRFDWAAKKTLTQQSEFRRTRRIPQNSSGRRYSYHGNSRK